MGHSRAWPASSVGRERVTLRDVNNTSFEPAYLRVQYHFSGFNSLCTLSPWHLLTGSMSSDNNAPSPTFCPCSSGDKSDKVPSACPCPHQTFAHCLAFRSSQQRGELVQVGITDERSRAQRSGSRRSHLYDARNLRIARCCGRRAHHQLLGWYIYKYLTPIKDPSIVPAGTLWTRHPHFQHSSTRSTCSTWSTRCIWVKTTRPRRRYSLRSATRFSSAYSPNGPAAACWRREPC